MSGTEGSTANDDLPAWADEWPSVVAGDRVEREAIELHSLDPVTDHEATWMDARTEAALFPSTDLPFGSICVVEPDTPVEVKGALPRQSHGDESRRGRWMFQRRSHDRLVEEGGVYLLTVYVPRQSHPGVRFLGQAILPAVVMGDLLEESWYEAPSSRSETTIAKKSWSQVSLFDVDQIEALAGGSR